MIPLTSSLGLAAAAIVLIPLPAQSQWAISWHTDEMTDERYAIFSLKAATLTRTVIGARDRTTLVLRCSKGSLDDAYVVLNAFTPPLSEQEWTEATIHEVYLAFLRAEWSMLPMGLTAGAQQLVDRPDLNNSDDNSRRAALLFARREPLLVKVPSATEWYKVRHLQRHHLNELLVIGRCGWDSEGNDNNELPKVAERVPITLLGEYDNWSAPILWSHTRRGPFTIVEGNKRLLALAGATTRDFSLSVFIGLSPSACPWHLPDTNPHAHS